MEAFKFVFWVCVFLVFYNYLGYALIVGLINRVSRRNKRRTHELFTPSVSFIVAAFNEEQCIRQKILNARSLDYPADRIEFIFVTDGSTDQTDAIIQEYPWIRLLHNSLREGTAAAM